MQPPANPGPSSPPPPDRPRRSGAKTFFLVLLLLIAAFLAGYIPSLIRARKLDTTLRATQLELRLASLHRRVGVAATEAQRNNFASALTSAREFFDGCTALSTSEAFETQPRTKNAIAGYVSQRDEVMAQLAAADPQVKERLASLVLVMDGVLTRRE